MALHESWLQKKGLTSKFAWQKRFCTLSATELCYYENSNKVAPVGIVAITPLTKAFKLIDPAAPGKSSQYRAERNFSFVIDCDPSAGEHRRLHYFCAADEQILQDWLKAIAQASGHMLSGTQHAAPDEAAAPNAPDVASIPLPSIARPASDSECSADQSLGASLAVEHRVVNGVTPVTAAQTKPRPRWRMRKNVAQSVPPGKDQRAAPRVAVVYEGWERRPATPYKGMVLASPWSMDFVGWGKHSRVEQ
jgi:hypothetical protein